MMVSNDVDPASLPPTERATHFHALRVFFEMQRSIKLDLNCGLNPRDWGWEEKDGQLVPIKTDLPVAPEFLLQVIRCNCKMSSKNTCGSMVCKCRKNGLQCVPACGDCRGVSCNNSADSGVAVNNAEVLDFEDGNAFENLFGLV